MMMMIEMDHDTRNFIHFFKNNQNKTTRTKKLLDDR